MSRTWRVAHAYNVRRRRALCSLEPVVDAEARVRGSSSPLGHDANFRAFNLSWVRIVSAGDVCAGECALAGQPFALLDIVSGRSVLRKLASQVALRTRPVFLAKFARSLLFFWPSCRTRKRYVPTLRSRKDRRVRKTFLRSEVKKSKAKSALKKSPTTTESWEGFIRGTKTYVTLCGAFRSHELLPPCLRFLAFGFLAFGFLETRVSLPSLLRLWIEGPISSVNSTFAEFLTFQTTRALIVSNSPRCSAQQLFGFWSLRAATFSPPPLSSVLSVFR